MIKHLLPYFFGCFAAYCWIQLIVPRLRHAARWKGGARMSVRSQFCFAMFPSLLLFTHFKAVALVVVLLAFADFAFLWFFGIADQKRYAMLRRGAEASPSAVEKIFQKPEAIVAALLFVAIIAVMLRIFFG